MHRVTTVVLKTLPVVVSWLLMWDSALVVVGVYTASKLP